MRCVVLSFVVVSMMSGLLVLSLVVFGVIRFVWWWIVM